MIDEPFRLLSEKAPRPPGPRRYLDNEASRQRALFSGLDCLAGQRDLFATDGEPPQQEPGHEGHHDSAALRLGDHGGSEDGGES